MIASVVSLFVVFGHLIDSINVCKQDESFMRQSRDSFFERVGKHICYARDNKHLSRPLSRRDKVYKKYLELLLVISDNVHGQNILNDEIPEKNLITRHNM